MAPTPDQLAARQAAAEAARARIFSAQPAKKEGGLGGLLGEVGDILSGMPTGMAALGQGVAQDWGNLTRLPSTLVSGLADKMGAPDWLSSGLGAAAGATAMQGSGLGAEQAAAQAFEPIRPYLPTLTGRDVSFDATKPTDLLETDPNKSILGNFSDKMTELFPTHRNLFFDSPGRTIGRTVETAHDVATGNFADIPYVKAYQNGGLLGTALEDAANLAAVGGVVTHGLTGAAQLATQGEGRLADAAAAAGDFSHLPPPPVAPIDAAAEAAARVPIAGELPAAPAVAEPLALPAGPPGGGRVFTGTPEGLIPENVPVVPVPPPEPALVNPVDVGHVPQRVFAGPPAEPLTAPPMEGTVRLYRGAQPTANLAALDSESGKWFTTDPAMAERYARGGTLSYVDVPRSVAESTIEHWSPTRIEDGLATDRLHPEAWGEFVLPDEIAKSAQTIADRSYAGRPGITPTTLPPSPSEMAAQAAADRAAANPFGATYEAGRLAREQAIGDRLAPYAPQIRGLADAAASGTGLAGKIASVPFAPITVPASMLKAGQAIAAGTPEELGVIGRAAAQVPGLSDVLGAVGEKVNSAQEHFSARQHLLNREAAMTAGQIHDWAAEQGPAWNKLNLDEQVAAHTALIGDINPANIEAVKRMGPEELQRAFPGVTPESVAVLDDYYKQQSGINPGSAREAPPMVSKIDAALEASAPMRESAQGRYLSGYGEQQVVPPEGTPERAAYDAYRQANVGDQPVQQMIERDIANPDKALQNGMITKDEHAEIKTALKSGDEEALNYWRDQLAQKPDYAPPDWRPMLKGNEAARQSMLRQADELAGTEGHDPAVVQAYRELANDIPTTLDDAQAAGLSPRGHIIGGESPSGLPLSNGPKFGVRKTGGEYMKQGVLADRTAAGQLSAHIHRFAEQTHNEAVREVLTNPDLTTKPVDLVGAAGTGKDVMAAAEARGMVPYDTLTGKEVRSADGIRVNDAVVDGKFQPATVLVEKPIMKAIEDTKRQVYADNLGGKILKANDKAIGYWKMAVLPLSPKWNIGNIIGNAMMAATQLKPGDLNARNIAETWRQMKSPDEWGAQVQRRGFNDVIDQSQLGDVREQTQAGPVRQAVKGVTSVGYRANQFVDDFGHTLLYVAKKNEGEAVRAAADGLLAEGKITAEQHANLVDKAFDKEKAVAMSLHTMGDFTNLSKLERDTIRRVFPFYAWYRHITQLAFSMPVTNPVRTAWTLNLANQYRLNEGLPDFLKTAVPLGGGTFLRAPWNPFPGAAPEDNPLLNPAKALGGMNPLLQIPLNAFGLNTGRGRLMTGPPGTMPATQTGTAGMGFIGVKNLLGFLPQYIPQGRTLMDMARQPVVRYDTGQPIFQGGKPIPLTSNVLPTVPGPIPGGPGVNLNPVMQFLTGASLDQPNLKEQQARIAKNQAKTAKMQTQYEKNRAKNGV